MRTRDHDWLDTQSGAVLYGIQVLVGGVWRNASEGRKPLLFSTASERNKKRKELRRIRIDAPASN